MQFLRKNSKIQNGRHFWQDKIFLKIGMATLQRYPVGQKFRRNRSIWHGFRDISIFVFCNFAKNLKIQNGRHFLREIFCLKIGMATLQRYPAGQKFRRNRSI